jgi:hypothetical protein
MRRQEVEMGATRASALQKVKDALSFFAVVGAVFASIPAARAEETPRPKVGLARADGGDTGFALNAEVDCSPLAHPGKVQCIVRLRPVGGTLHFSDAIVLSAPPFARPLRDRIVVRAGEHSDGAELPLILTAMADGDGELYVMGRATVCGARGCRSVQAEASARVVVGESSGAP